MSRTRRNWTAQEDELLRAAVLRVADKTAQDQGQPLLWRELAKSVPRRTNKDCRRRWWNCLANSHIRGSWAEEEDERLIAAVQKYGTNWSQVANEVGSRNSDQCSSHWNQVLNPNINYCDWTEDEDANLLHEVLTHGTNWATIAGFHIPNRTTLALKNRYSTLRLKNENRKKARYGESEANKKSQSEGVNTNALQTTQWEARDLTNPKAPKESSQSNSNKNGGSNNNDEEDDDDDDDDDDYCEEDYEMDENERARADVEISRQKSGSASQRSNISNNKSPDPTIALGQSRRSPSAGQARNPTPTELQMEDCIQFDPSSVKGSYSSLPVSVYPSPGSTARSLDAESMSKEGSMRESPMKSFATNMPPSAAVMVSPTDVLGSKISPDSGFPHLEGSIMEEPSSYSTLQSPWAFSSRFNISISMTCDQHQMQSIITNLSHLGTDINIHFQRV
ncbi:DNA-binding protein eta2 [Pyrenophora tritici-repentis]|nr:DNA-binding protein eta2 [Pyrenophora tritici-repentis]